MEEVTTGVLHNVGNVLNSANVSVNVMSDQLRSSRLSGLAKTVAMMNDQVDNLGAFITSDEKGKQLLGYLAQLSGYLADERAHILAELEGLRANIEHINTIVSAQQSYAGVAGVVEPVRLADLIDDALRMNGPSLERHAVQVARPYDDSPTVTVDKQKLLQVLLNLVRNATQATCEGRQEGRRLTLRIERCGEDRVRIEVTDNGVGIPAENLTKIFAHGFTTKQAKGGHGFGLHHSALSIRERGGSLGARSNGPGSGSTFTIELPVQPATTS